MSHGVASQHQSLDGMQELYIRTSYRRWTLLHSHIPDCRCPPFLRLASRAKGLSCPTYTTCKAFSFSGMPSLVLASLPRAWGWQLWRWKNTQRTGWCDLCHGHEPTPPTPEINTVQARGSGSFFDELFWYLCY